MSLIEDRFILKRGDRREPIRRTLRDSAGAVVDLTSAQSVKFIMTRVSALEPRIKDVQFLATLLDGLTPKVNAAASIVQLPTTGEAEYVWVAADVDTEGVHLAEFEVTWNDGTKETFPNGTFIVVLIHPDLA